MKNSPEHPLNHIPQESRPNIEAEKKPRYIIMITRHAERLPSGELSPEGIAHAQAKGETLKGVDVLKSYASTHPGKMTYETGEHIGAQANVQSPQTGERYQTRTVKGIQYYDVLGSDLLEKVKLSIEESTLAEIAKEHPALAQSIDTALKEGAPTKTDSKGDQMADIGKLPRDIQRQIAPIRQKNQKIGFETMLHDLEAVRNMAAGLSHQIYNKELLLGRYAEGRDKKQQSPQDDVVVNLITHGVFTESLLKSAGIFVAPDGEETYGDDLNMEELGGYVQPGDSMYLDIGTDPSHIPERIPVRFDDTRSVQGSVYLDKSKIEELSEYYDENLKQS